MSLSTVHFALLQRVGKHSSVERIIQVFMQVCSWGRTPTQRDNNHTGTWLVSVVTIALAIVRPSKHNISFVFKPVITDYATKFVCETLLVAWRAGSRRWCCARARTASNSKFKAPAVAAVTIAIWAVLITAQINMQQGTIRATCRHLRTNRL